MVFTSCAHECGRAGAIGRDRMFVDWSPRFLPETENVDLMKGCHAKEFLKGSITACWEVLRS